mmetsp:Transcript_7833/g.11543  ORF Transcript_7833/g.11543 Transcript_7833/m.11543 type:complete len:353 (+) Transcript_7833:878-1936(+)
MALSQRNRCQLDAIDDVADRIDARHRGLEAFIHDDGASSIKLDTSSFTIKVLGARGATSGIHDNVGLLRRAVLICHLDATSNLFHLGDIGVELEVDTLVRVLGDKMLANILVEAAQPQVTANDLCRLGAIPRKDAGKLDSNVPTAHYDDTLGALIEKEGLIRSDGELAALDLGHHGPAANSHKDSLGCHLLAINVNSVSIDEFSISVNELHTGVSEHVLVDTVKPQDLLVLILNEPFPVEGGVSIFPAIMLRIMHVMGEVRAIGHELLGHTAHVDACATETTETSLLPVATTRALHQGHLSSVRGCYPRRAHATTSATNAQVVVIVVVVALHGSVENTTSSAWIIKLVPATP